MGSSGESAICSATNHSGDMKGAIAPAMLITLIRRIQSSLWDGTDSDIGSKTVKTSLGMVGRIDVIFAIESG
jgi:hypothetical protein